MTETSIHITTQKLRKVAGAALIGSSLEWYDFFLYATASALVFGQVFFPNRDPALGTLLALGTFGVGFFARPIGAIIFGSIGDRIGRKPALVATLILMGITTMLIGLVPGYDTIGIVAPIVLVLLRLLQGLGAGAEHAGATIFATEYAKPASRGIFGSIPSSGLYVGVLLSSSIYGLFATMPEDMFLAWGWRIPFLLSAVLVGVGLYIRLRIEETPEFQDVEKNDEVQSSPLVATFRDQWRSVLIVLGVVAGPFTATYAYQTYSLSYMKTYLGVTGGIGTLSLTVASAVAILVVPLAGALSDRIGRRPVVIVGALFSGAFAFPFFGLLGTLSPTGVILAMVGGVGIGVPLMLGAQGALLSELFSAGNRFTGFSVSRELGSILFAGMTPFIAAILVAAASGSSWPVSLYVIGACSLTLVTALVIGETRDQNGSSAPESKEHTPTTSVI
jgi:MHS family shikimate/dehydroshikimate transporter-like MFS transporter